MVITRFAYSMFQTIWTSPGFIILVYAANRSKSLLSTAESASEEKPLVDLGAEEDNHEDCWTYGGIDKLSGGLMHPSVCCRNSPCGIPDCWRPPEMTYDFCCKMSACRPLAIGEIQRALLVLPTLQSSGNLTHLSRRAYKLAGLHLRALLSALPGLRLRRRANDMFPTNCSCAIALAASEILLADAMDADRMSPSWFAYELHWDELLVHGWGPLFYVLSRRRSKLIQSDAGLKLRESLKHLQMPPDLKEIDDLYMLMRNAQKHAQLIASKAEALDYDFSYFISALQHVGILDLVARRIEDDLRERRRGKRCSATYPISMIPFSEMTASQSSTRAWRGEWPAASRPLTMRPQPHWEAPGTTCTHTFEDSPAWWNVTLHSRVQVVSVKLTNRKDCCPERLQSIDIFIGSAKCAANVSIPAGATKEIPCNGEGSVIRVQHRNSSSFLTLCGFEAYAQARAVEWSNCEPWAYSVAANFSSPKPNVELQSNPNKHAVSLPTVAVCVLGAPRTVIETYTSIRKMVVAPLKGDVFAYVPFSGSMSHELEKLLKNLGPLVTAIVTPDVDAEGMRERYYSEERDPQIGELYRFAAGPFKSPLHGEMGSVMWSYFSQSICRRMVEAHEEQRDWKYRWVIFARADMYWTRAHPPEEVLNAKYVHVPFGQDNSFYAHGQEWGINDRHAAIPRHLATSYLGRWEAFTRGKSWSYLKSVAQRRDLTNAEQFLFMHLREEGVPIARFAPVAYLAMCVESPQCLHLYKGTTLGKRQWTYSAKYFSELVEVVRTNSDPVHVQKWPEAGWMWSQVPVNSLHPDVSKPWHLFTLEMACCVNPSGPVTCKWWDLFRKCKCLG